MNYRIINVTPDNVVEHKLFCIKDVKAQGFKDKKAWFTEQYANGLRMKILQDENEMQIGFVEYVPGQHAWRPVKAAGFMFIHCIYVSKNKNKGLGLGSKLISEVENDARKLGMNGVCAMVSRGAWMADSRVFERNGFIEVDTHDRYLLMSKRWNETVKHPSLIDWEVTLSEYQGWHVLYADQCPWHVKAIEVMSHIALEHGIDLHVTKLHSPLEAQQAPSGYGVFSLIHNGQLIEDHYISGTRFKNILRAELKIEI